MRGLRKPPSAWCPLGKAALSPAPSWPHLSELSRVISGGQVLGVQRRLCFILDCPTPVEQSHVPTQPAVATPDRKAGSSSLCEVRQSLGLESVVGASVEERLWDSGLTWG